MKLFEKIAKRKHGEYSITSTLSNSSKQKTNSFFISKMKP